MSGDSLVSTAREAACHHVGPTGLAFTAQMWYLLRAEHHQEGVVLSLMFWLGPKLAPSQG